MRLLLKEDCEQTPHDYLVADHILSSSQLVNMTC